MRSVVQLTVEWTSMRTAWSVPGQMESSWSGVFSGDRLFAQTIPLSKELTLRWRFPLYRFRAIRVIVLHLIHTTTHRIRAHLERIIRL